MRDVISSWAIVFALLFLPFAGCSGSTDGGGGDSGAGGTAGTGGTGGGGTGGAGGSDAVEPDLWTGSGQGGADGAFTICFNVREDGQALSRPQLSTVECGLDSLKVEFEPPCEGFFSTNEEIEIVNGSFSLLNEQGGLAGYWDISGTFDGDTAAGEATVQAVGDSTCSGSWTASPAP